MYCQSEYARWAPNVRFERDPENSRMPTRRQFQLV
jgi:hypothetical protein